MAQLRAKQIKLNAVDDIILGGVGGSGRVLPVGTAGQVLRVLTGGELAYEKVAGSDVTFDKGASDLVALDLNAAVLEVLGLVEAEQARAEAAELAIDVELNNVEASVGLKLDGTQNLWANGNYFTAGRAEDATDPENVIPAIAPDTFKVAIEKLDLALAATDAAVVDVNTRIDDLTASQIAFVDTASDLGATNIQEAIEALDNRLDVLDSFDILKFKGVLDASGPSEALPATPLVGDVWRISAGGNFDGALSFSVNAGDFIAYGENDAWVKFDNTDPTVSGGTNITVTPVGDTEYQVSLSGIVAQANGGTGISTATVAGDVNKVLRVGATGALEYGYVSAIRDASGVAVTSIVGGKLAGVTGTDGEDDALSFTTKGYVEGLVEDAVEAAGRVAKSKDFVAVATETTFAVDEVIVGVPSVYFNGLRLKTADFEISTGDGVVLVLDTDSIGYAVGAGDVITIDYVANANPV